MSLGFNTSTWPTKKTQPLANFITKCSHEVPNTRNEEVRWKLFVHQTLCKNVRGVGIVLKGSNGVTFKYALRLVFKAINNMVEYEAFSKGLNLIKGMKLKKLSVYSGPQLMVG